MPTPTSLSDDLPGVIVPGDLDWDTARTPWNLAVDQHPTAVYLPHSADDVVAAVTAARRHGLRVAAQGTGHGAAALAAHGELTDTLLLDMSTMRAVTIDPIARTARVEAGVVWAEVTQPAAEHGLAALAGSSPDVGVVGYTLGGGLSWMARAHGLAANQVTAAEVVTADAQRRWVDATHEADIFWALRGGGGNVGVVTALEFHLLEVTDILAGAMFWPMDRAADVLSAWRRWVDGVPESVTSVARVLNLPPLPDIPEPLRGNSFAVIEAAMLVDDEEGARLLAPLRELGPAMDTFARIPMPGLAGLHMDPPGPAPALADGLLLTDLDEAAIADFAAVAAAEPMLLSGEFRQLGGALRPGRVEGGAVSALEGDFLCFAVGMVPEPAAAPGVAAAVGRALATLHALEAPRSFTNFRESPTDPRRLYGASLERLRAIRATYDPDGILRAHQPVD